MRALWVAGACLLLAGALAGLLAPAAMAAAAADDTDIDLGGGAAPAAGGATEAGTVAAEAQVFSYFKCYLT